MSFVAVGVAGAGLIVGGIAAVQANKEAHKMDELAKTVPQAQQSQYPGLMIDQAKAELNAQNPFLAYQNRAIQGTQADSQAMAAKASLDPTMLLAMTQKYNDATNSASMKNMMANYGLRDNKLQNLYRGYQMGQQQDQMNYDNSMTGFNSKANLMNAAGQTRVSATQNMSNGLLAAGTAGIKAGGYGAMTNG